MQNFLLFGSEPNVSWTSVLFYIYFAAICCGFYTLICNYNMWCLGENNFYFAMEWVSIIIYLAIAEFIKMLFSLRK